MRRIICRTGLRKIKFNSRVRLSFHRCYNNKGHNNKAVDEIIDVIKASPVWMTWVGIAGGIIYGIKTQDERIKIECGICPPDATVFDKSIHTLCKKKVMEGIWSFPIVGGVMGYFYPITILLFGWKYLAKKKHH